MKHRDLAGVEVKIGSYVAYAASLGRCPILKYGVVTRLAERKDTWNEDMRPTIRVITVERDERFTGVGKPKGISWEIQKKGQEIALGFLERLIVVTILPDAAKKILDNALAERKKNEQASKR